MATEPRFPVYIPSKSRAGIAKTMRALDLMGVPFRVVVEEAQREEYAEHYGDERLLTLDPAYQERYDTCDEHGGSFSRGSGPARNFIWDHAQAEGHSHHWIMDDNLVLFERFHENQRIPVADGSPLWLMEEFVLRYRNVGMAGPNYHMFVPSRQRRKPYRTGTRIYSCILIRNDIRDRHGKPLRWRGRYNEDTDLSLRVLKAGWATVLFDAYLQWKMPTQALPGGNTEAFYSDKGTLPKSEMLVRQHPDVARVVWRFGRWHHHVDYSRWRGQRLVPRPGVTRPETSPIIYRKVPRAGHTRPA